MWRAWELQCTEYNPKPGQTGCVPKAFGNYKGAGSPEDGSSNPDLSLRSLSYPFLLSSSPNVFQASMTSSGPQTSFPFPFGVAVEVVSDVDDVSPLLSGWIRLIIDRYALRISSRVAAGWTERIV